MFKSSTLSREKAHISTTMSIEYMIVTVGRRELKTRELRRCRDYDNLCESEHQV